MRRPPVLAATLLATTLALSACGGTAKDTAPSRTTTSAEPSAPSSTTPSIAPSEAGTTPSSGTTVDITIKNGKVTPNGERVKAELGAPVTLKIDADTSGEIHVHSTPEQQIEFEKGTSTHQLTIEQPGIIDVEDHALDQVIVQLQVS
jgi:hypothetical protein